MLGMLQLLTQYQYIDPMAGLAGVTAEAVTAPRLALVGAKQPGTTKPDETCRTNASGIDAARSWSPAGRSRRHKVSLPTRYPHRHNRHRVSRVPIAGIAGIAHHNSPSTLEHREPIQKRMMELLAGAKTQGYRRCGFVVAA
jgi:hypothetical protein